MASPKLTPAHGSEPADWDGTHIKFRMTGESPSGKTQIWTVLSNDDIVLGVIAWFSRWRKYSFYPVAETVYEQTCLREIAQFVDDRMREQRTGI